MSGQMITDLTRWRRVTMAAPRSPVSAYADYCGRMQKATPPPQIVTVRTAKGDELREVPGDLRKWRARRAWIRFTFWFVIAPGIALALLLVLLTGGYIRATVTSLASAVGAVWYLLAHLF